MRADVFLAGAVAMVNRNFGAPLIMTFHSRGARAKLRVNLQTWFQKSWDTVQIVKKGMQ